MSATGSPLTLVFRADSHVCALPLSKVVEILRPLPVKPLAGAPNGVRGFSIVRGAPVPVVDLAALFGGASAPGTRFVVVRVQERRIALSVGAVLGIREFSPSDWSALPPLLGNACPGVIEAIGALDHDAILALEAGNLLPDAVWASLAGQEA